MQRNGDLRNIIYKLNAFKVAPFEPSHVSSMCFKFFEDLKVNFFVFKGYLKNKGSNDWFFIFFNIFLFAIRITKGFQVKNIKIYTICNVKSILEVACGLILNLQK